MTKQELLNAFARAGYPVTFGDAVVAGLVDPDSESTILVCAGGYKRPSAPDDVSILRALDFIKGKIEFYKKVTIK